MNQTLKVCGVCGQDVSQVKRVKDAHGNYYCRPCWEGRVEAARAGLAATTDPSVRPDAAANASEASPAPTTATGVQQGMPSPAIEMVSIGPDLAKSPRRRLPISSNALIGIIIAAVVIVVAGLFGVKHLGGRGGGRDMLANPELLLRPPAPYAELNLGGVAIGDPEKSIAADRIEKQTEESVTCKDGAYYSVKDGKISGFSVQGAFLQKAKISTKAEVLATLGKPDRIEKVSEDGEMYWLWYDEKHLMVVLEGDHVDGIAFLSKSTLSQSLKGFVGKSEPFVKQIRLLKSNIDLGISFAEFKPQMVLLDSEFSDVTDTCGDKDVQDALKYATKAMEHYRNALSLWRGNIQSGLQMNSLVQSELKKANQQAEMFMNSFASIKARSGGE